MSTMLVGNWRTIYLRIHSILNQNKTCFWQSDFRLRFYWVTNDQILLENVQNSVQTPNAHFLGRLTRSDISAAARRNRLVQPAHRNYNQGTIKFNAKLSIVGLASIWSKRMLLQAKPTCPRGHLFIWLIVLGYNQSLEFSSTIFHAQRDLWSGQII